MDEVTSEHAGGSGKRASFIGMLVPDFFRRMAISPRVSFWISSAALAIVLFNNHVYITYVQGREKEAVELIEKNRQQASELDKREQLLRRWALQLEQREAEVRLALERFTRPKEGR